MSTTDHFALYGFAAIKIVPTKNVARAIFRKETNCCLSHFDSKLQKPVESFKKHDRNLN